MAALTSYLSSLFSSGAGRLIPGTQSGVSRSYPFSSPKSVNADTALCFSAFWASVKLIVDSVSCMPLKVYEKKGQELVEKNDHWLAELFNYKPNRYQNRIGFMGTMTLNQAIHGNCFAKIEKRTDGSIISLMPMMSEQTEVFLEQSGNVVFKFQKTPTEKKVYPYDAVWHVPLMGNGLIGLSPLSYARNSIGIGLAADGAVGKVYSNGSKPSGILSIDRVLPPAQKEKVKESFADLASGSEDTLMLLEAGMKYDQVSMTPQDIELLQSRHFQIDDVARFMGVPSILINHGQGTGWGTGIENIIQAFYKLGLRPYLERFELGIETSLLSVKERGKIKVEFDFNALLRADMAARFKVWSDAVSRALMTPNEARAEEGLEAKEGGDELYMQQQMVPLSMLVTGAGLKAGVKNEQNPIT